MTEEETLHKESYKEIPETVSNTVGSEQEESAANVVVVESDYAVTPVVSPEESVPENESPAQDNHVHDGDFTVENDMFVGGTLRARRIVHPWGCLFHRFEDLKKEFPHPYPGMWVMVGATYPYDIYRCNVIGKWELVKQYSFEYQISTYLSEHEYAKLSDIPKFPSLADYATKDWVKEQLKGLDTGATKFDELFEKVENGTDADGNIKWAIRAKYGLFSTEFIATRGTSDDSGASGGGIDVTFLEDYLAGKSYATESWVSDKLVNYWTKAESDNRYQPKGNYLTQHQDISHLLSKTDAATLYQPKGNYVTSITKAMVENVLTGTISTHTHDRIVTRGRVSAALKKADLLTGLSMQEGYGDTAYGVSYCNVINVKGANAQGASQLVLEWSGGQTESSATADMASMRLRSCRDNMTDWTPWRVVAFTDNTYTKAEADGRFVDVSGDTMTGGLVIENANLPLLTLKRLTAGGGAFVDYQASNQASTWWRVGQSGNADNFVFEYHSDTSFLIGMTLTHKGQLQLAAAQGTAPLAVSSNTVVANLNADLLDGVHNGHLTANRLSNRAYISDLNSPSWNTLGLTYCLFNNTAQNTPTKVDNANGVLNISAGTHGTSGEYGGQLAFQNNGRLYWRGWAAGTPSEWHTIAYLEDVYTKAEADGRYVSLTENQRITGAKTFTDIRLDGQGENVNMPFFLGIDAYKDGGAVKYITASKVAAAISVYTKAESDNKYVTKADLAEMFTIVTEGGKRSIKAMMGLWSADWIATKGQSDSGGTSGAGIDVTFLESYLKGDNADKAVYATQSWVGSTIDSKLTAYATQSWVNSQGFLKSHQSLANYVTLNSAQTITGMKTFASDIMMGDSTVNGCMIKWVRNTDWAQIWFKNASDSDTDSYLGFQTGDNGNEYFRFSTKMSGNSADTVWATIKSGGITANGFIKSGGTSTQALMADGSVRAVHTLSEVTNLGWSGTSGQLATINTLAYWDGAYQGVGSNLRYCDRGRFGSMATANKTDYVRALYDQDVLSGDMNEMLSNRAFIGSINATANAPHGGGWYNVIQLPHRNGSGDGSSYVGQIALGMTVNHEQMYFRTHRTRTWQHVLTEGNYESILNNLYYTEAEVNSLVGAKVAKAGDTMTGDLLFSNSGTGIRQIRFTMGDNDFSRIAVGATASNAGWMEIATADDGTEPIYVRQYSGTYTSIVRTATLLDGSGNTAFPGRVTASYFTANSTTLCSNLNADLLDGRHSNGFSWRKSIGMQSDTHGAYVLLCPAYDGTLLDGGFFYGTVYITRGNAGAFNAKTAVMVQCGGQYNANLAQYQVLSASVSILGLFKVKYNGTAYIALKMAPTSIMNFAVEGMWGGNSDPMVVNSDGAGVTEEAALSTTPQIASNAQSATRLQGTYKLWGRDFYGNDVDGAMTINYTGETGIALYRKEAGSGAFIRFYNASQTANYFRMGMFADSRFGIGYNSGMDAINILTNGNVGIGTTAPAYKLDVNGTISAVAMRTGGSFFLSRDGSLKIYTKDTTYGSETVCLQTCIDGADGETHDYVTSQAGRCIMALQPRGGKVTVGNIAASDYALTATSFLCDTWVRTSGQHGWFNQTYKGGWYMTDENWIRNYNNKSLYMTTATIRTDGRIEVGSNGSKFLVDSSGNVTTIGKLTLNLSGENIVSSFYKLNSTSNNPYLNLKIGSLDYYVQAYNSKLCMGPNASKGISVDHVGNVEMSGDARIYGNLLLKSDDNYGNRLNFGDGDFVYLSETEDDELHIYADQGIYLDSDGGYITIAENTGLSFFGAGLLSADTAMKAIRCSCGFYSDKFISTKGTADTSDMRFKRVVGSVDLTVAQIAEAPLFTFEWRDEEEPGVFVGTSAQYWEKVLPQSVIRLNDRRHLFYGELALAGSIVNSRAIERMTARYDRWLGKHETRVQRLERRVRELEKELETLKNKEYAA